MKGPGAPAVPEAGDPAARDAAGIPSPWGQAFPRAVRPPPDGLLVPSGTLRALIRKTGRLEVIYTGLALAPRIGNGERVALDARGGAGPGDLVLCDASGWGDIRRILRRAPDGSCVTALDPCPGGRETLAGDRVIASLGARTGPRRAADRAIARLFPLWSRLAALRYWCRKILAAPDFEDRGADSVRRKYAGQVDRYTELTTFPLDPELRELLRRSVAAGATILVAGSGAGGELIRLAQEGYRVTGVDYLAAMVKAAEANARRAGVEVEVVCADMGDLDPGERRFDGAYITPLVYSFVPGRARRIETLRRLGELMVPGGSVIFSAYLITNMKRLLQAVLAWSWRAVRGRGSELGDWFTWFLQPDGSLDMSFTHLFLASDVRREARRAGFRTCRRVGGYFVATDFKPKRR